MSKGSEFVSCFSINGRPILPPVMTAARRSEMQEYKLKALAVEERLKERKSKGIKSLKSKLVRNEEENKENDDLVAIPTDTCQNVLTNVDADIESTKLPLSERMCLKEVPSPRILEEQIITPPLYQDLILPVSTQDYPEDSTYSVPPSGSTDLRPYLDSTLEDISPDVFYEGLDSSRNRGRCTDFSANASEIGKIMDTPMMATRVAELDRKFMEIKFTPLEKIDGNLISVKNIEKASNASGKSIKNFKNESACVAIAFRSDEHHARDNSIGVSRLNSSDSLKCDSESLECLNAIQIEKKTKNSFSDSEKNVSALSTKSEDMPYVPESFKSEPEIKDVSVSEDSFKETSSECVPRLVRRGSYTLESPSPILSANIDRFKVDALPSQDIRDKSPDFNITNHIISDGSEKEIDIHESDNNTAIKKPDLLSSSAKTIVRNAKFPAGNGSKSSLAETKAGKYKSSLMKESSREQIKNSSTKGSVFERLAADGAKKAEERRRWTKENNFKLPRAKKVPKVKGILRAAASYCNIRTSLSDGLKKSSTLLPARLSRSASNIVSLTAEKGVRKKNAPIVQHHTLTSKSEKQIIEPIIGPSGITLPSSSAIAVEIQKNLTKNSEGKKDSPSRTTSPKKELYTVQTSPISPPLPDNATECDDAGPRRRSRRRWFENSSSFNRAVESNCTVPTSLNVISSIPVSLNDIPKDLSKLEIESPNKNTLSGSQPKDKYPCFIADDVTPLEIGHQVVEPTVTLVPKKDIHDLSNNKTEKTITVETNTDKNVDTLTADISLSTIEMENNQTAEKKNTCSVDENEVDKFLPTEKSMSIPPSAIPFEKKKSLKSEYFEINFSSSGRKSIVQHSPDLLKAKPAVALNPELQNTSNKSIEIKGIVKDKNEINQATPPLTSCKKIPSDLLLSIRSLPETPVGPYGAKDVAFRLLNRLVEEQDKAMNNLLEEQRVQAENMQKRFKEQQKHLVGKLTRVFSALPSPDKNEVKITRNSNIPCTKNQAPILHSDSSSAASSTETEMSVSPFIHNRKKFTSNATSTPTQVFENMIKGTEFKRGSFDLATDSISPLSPSKYIDPNCISEIESKLLEAKENISVLENSSQVICSMCQVFHSSSDKFKCCLQDSNITLKADSNTANTDTLVMRDDDVKSDNQIGDNEDRCQNEVSPLSPSSLAMKDITNVSGSSQISNSSYVSKGMESSTMIEGSNNDNVELDLSGILEMESKKKNMCISTKQSLDSVDVLQGTSSFTTSKTQECNDIIVDEVALHRQKYEEDLLRFIGSGTESNSAVAKDVEKDVDHSIIKSPFFLLKDNSFMESSIKECPVSRQEISIVQDLEIKKGMQSDLPDLRSETTALRTYLGALTPSVGPITLETPISTFRFAANEVDVSNSCSRDYTVENFQLNLKHESQKYRKSDSEYNDPLNKAEVNANNPSEFQLPIRSPSDSLSGSSSERRSNSEGSCTSENYTTASSKSQNQHTEFPKIDSEMLKRFGKLGAFVKGYLTRRLLKTARVIQIKAVIQDSLITALKLHSEVFSSGDVNLIDVQLHGRILAQLTAACNELHHICFELTTAQRMSIINADRQRLQSRSSTPIHYDAHVYPSPRPAILSAVTLKTLQRRFGNDLPNERKVREKSKSKTCMNERSKKRSSTLPVAKSTATGKVNVNTAGYARPTRDRSRSFAFSSVSDVREGNTTALRKQSINNGNKMKNPIARTNSKILRKSRRSSSAGEINRRPWR